jgi:ATP-dependent DNA helicase DinG
LFLADLALRTARQGYASAIPSYDAAIFDEAHQIEDIATDFFGVRASSARVEALVRDAEKSLATAGKLEILKLGGVRATLDLAREAARMFFATLASARSASEPRRLLEPRDLDDAALEAHATLDARLHALEAYCAEQRNAEPLAVVARRTRDLRSDLATIVRGARAQAPAADDDARAVTSVAWIDVRARSVSIGASPIDLGPTLREILFDRVPCIVCTSATLSTGGSFHFAKTRLGALRDADELVVPSPFDFASRAALYLPGDLPEPADPAFERAASDRIADLARMTGGGGFVLCTSNRAMKGLHAALRGRVDGPLLLQGEAPKHLLLSKFRDSGRAVLVATMSFWEGVDVPGWALRLVVIDKIPFAVPSDPLVASRCARIDREGGNSFTQYSVPCAAITLKQGFGRLIRTQTDAGIVAVLDRRIVRKGYGRTLLASLPPARRVTLLDELRAFWDRIVRERSPS